MNLNDKIETDINMPSYDRANGRHHRGVHGVKNHLVKQNISNNINRSGSDNKLMLRFQFGMIKPNVILHNGNNRIVMPVHLTQQKNQYRKFN